MTDYEIADLAASNAQLFQGLFSLLQMQGSLIIQNLTLFYSLVFGYVLAAYVVGRRLTTVQAAILSVLYLAAAIYNRLSGVIIVGGMIELNRQMDEMVGMVAPKGLMSQEGQIVIAVFVILSMLASLYFMWSVRHPKTE
jgi:hypothetical protein